MDLSQKFFYVTMSFLRSVTNACTKMNIPVGLLLELGLEARLGKSKLLSWILARYKDTEDTLSAFVSNAHKRFANFYPGFWHFAMTLKTFYQLLFLMFIKGLHKSWAPINPKM